MEDMAISPSEGLAYTVWRKLSSGEFDEKLGEILCTALADSSKRDEFMTFVIHRVMALNYRSIFWGDLLASFDKTLGFLEDPVFVAAHRELMKGKERFGPQAHSWRLHSLIWAAKCALALPEGDFVECGVFKGDTAWFVGEVAGVKTSARRFFLYDSFKGVDPRIAEDDDYPSDLPGFLPQLIAGQQVPGLQAAVIQRFAEWSNYRVIGGYLPAALKHEDAPEKIAYLHIDLNSPKAELNCYEALFPKLVPGAVVVLDDYGWDIYKKQKRVADAFFSARGIEILQVPTGQGIAIVPPSALS